MEKTKCLLREFFTSCRRSRASRRLPPLTPVLVWLLLWPVICSESSLRAQKAATFFRQNCTSCHTIGGGKLTGPDLKNVSQRRSRQWLANYIPNPRAVIDSGDPYAQKLVSQARGIIMPTLPGLTADRVQSILDLIQTESRLEHSHFEGIQIANTVFTSRDILKGERIFRGLAPLGNGGPACISCHNVSGVGLLRGGRLGPDLTLAFERLGGRQALASWLLAPPTPTMQPTFRTRLLDQKEILPLVAFLEDATKNRRQEDRTVPTMYFFLFGLGGMILGLVIFESAWRNRFQAVRRRIVHKRQRRGQA